jgi:uncharacterized membrane protein YdjX (TVP38/TMEM64 family)
MLPGTILYVVGGDAVVKIIMRGKLPLALVVVIVGVVLFITVLVRYAKGRIVK